MIRIQKEVVQKLKDETKSNPAAAPVFHLLALRERSRQTLNLNALRQSMKKEGFDFSSNEYRGVLKALAKAGIATAVTNRLGNCVGLKDIQVSLPELGEAVCANEALVTIRKKALKPQAVQPVSEKPITALEVVIDGVAAVIKFPKGLNTKELKLVLDRINTTS